MHGWLYSQDTLGIPHCSTFPLVLGPDRPPCREHLSFYLNSDKSALSLHHKIIHTACKMSQIKVQRAMFLKSSTFPRSNVSAPFRRDLLPVSSETSEAGVTNYHPSMCATRQSNLCVQSGSPSAQKRCITVKTHPYLLPEASITYLQSQGGSLHAPQVCPNS